jgi:hypothetical protein
MIRLVSAMFFVAAVLAPLGAADAATYPGNKCVSDKLKETSKLCSAILKAWSAWDKNQDTTTRNQKLASAGDKFVDKWNGADTKAADQGADCADTTLPVANAQNIVDLYVGNVITAINTGLNLSNPDDGKCGSKLLKEAAKRCQAFLKEESKLIKDPNKDPDRVKYDQGIDKASTKFTEKFDDILADACPSTATSAGVAAEIDDLNLAMVESTTISPNIPSNSFRTITMPAYLTPGNKVEYLGREYEPSCGTISSGSNFDQFSFFAKRGVGADANNLIVYYEGGGACWDHNSCEIAETTDRDVSLGECVAGFCDGDSVNDGDPCTDDDDCGGCDDPNAAFGGPVGTCAHQGFTDLDNPDNPFKDWSYIFIPTCTGDVFIGDTVRTYNGGSFGTKTWVHHGFHNSRVVEKFAREHFLNPARVVLAGSSAGSVGITLQHYFWHEVYAPAAEMTVLYDGFVDIIHQDFLDAPLGFASWDAVKNFPDGVPAPVAPTQEAIHILAAQTFPDTMFGHWTTAYDSDSGQTGFYHVMKNLDDILEWPNWWDSSCEWNGLLETQLAATDSAVTTNNYRYYVGSGTQHTMFRTNRVYTDTLGGVQLTVDWVRAMVERDFPNWENEQASPDNVLLPNDPRPMPLECPLKMDGPDTVVDCSVCP